MRARTEAVKGLIPLDNKQDIIYIEKNTSVLQKKNNLTSP